MLIAALLKEEYHIVSILYIILCVLQFVTTVCSLCSTLALGFIFCLVSIVISSCLVRWFSTIGSQIHPSVITLNVILIYFSEGVQPQESRATRKKSFFDSERGEKKLFG